MQIRVVLSMQILLIAVCFLLLRRGHLAQVSQGMSSWVADTNWRLHDLLGLPVPLSGHPHSVEVGLCFLGISSSSFCLLSLVLPLALTEKCLAPPCLPSQSSLWPFAGHLPFIREYRTGPGTADVSEVLRSKSITLIHSDQELLP